MSIFGDTNSVLCGVIYLFVVLYKIGRFIVDPVIGAALINVSGVVIVALIINRLLLKWQYQYVVLQKMWDSKLECFIEINQGTTKIIELFPEIFKESKEELIRKFEGGELGEEEIEYWDRTGREYIELTRTLFITCLKAKLVFSNPQIDRELIELLFLVKTENILILENEEKRSERRHSIANKLPNILELMEKELKKGGCQWWKSAPRR